MQKYTRNRRRKRSKSKRRCSRVRKTRKYVSTGGKRYTEYYDVSDIYLFNPDIDIFGDDFLNRIVNTPSKPIYGLYTISEWYNNENMPREKRAEELAKENKQNTSKTGPGRRQGLIEPMVEYINEKNKVEYDDAGKIGRKVNYPFVLSIPVFKYTDPEPPYNTDVLPAEIVPSPDSDKAPSPILPDDFLRFTHRSDILNTLFPFFMKIYVSLLKDLNQDIAETGQVVIKNREKNQKIMSFVLRTLREIHSFASPIWFNHIYNTFYDLGLNDYFKIANDGYNNYMQSLAKSLRETHEIPVETTMYSFPSFGDCTNANCKPSMNKIIHTYFVKNGDFDETEPIDNLLNMMFFDKDGKINAYSKLTNQMKKGPLRKLENLGEKGDVPGKNASKGNNGLSINSNP